MSRRMIPVKLTKGEYILPPEVAMRNRARLEAMNSEGLKARNMGGVAAYRAMGGAVYAQEGNFITNALDSAPAGSIGALGQAITDASYGRETTAWQDLANRRREDAKALEGEDEEIRSIQRIVQLATSAKSLVREATPALQVAQKAKSVLNSSLSDALDNAGFAASYLAALKTDANLAREMLNQYKLTAVREAVEEGTVSQASENAYTKMVADITDLTTVALNAQGSGPKTDFDFIVAARATANLDSSPDAIEASMQRMIDNANRTLRELGVEVDTSAGAQPATPVQETGAPASLLDAQNNPAYVAPGNQSLIAPHPGGPGTSPDTSLVSTERPSFIEVPSRFIVAIEAAGKVPTERGKRAATTQAYKALLEWLKEQEPTANIRMFEQEGTAQEFIDYIEGLLGGAQ